MGFCDPRSIETLDRSLSREAAPRLKHCETKDTFRSQALAPQALAPQQPKKGEEKQTDRHTVKTYVKEDLTDPYSRMRRRRGWREARREGMAGG